jgi:hypothetical protein
MYKSELAKLAGVSPRTFRRYLATRRPILTAMGVSPFARKLPPPAVHYISEDYCIDIPDERISRVPRYQKGTGVVGRPRLPFASPYVGGLGGSTPLLVLFSE